MQQSVVKFYCSVVQTLFNMFRALLCIVMPETFWAVSVRQSNKFYD